MNFQAQHSIYKNRTLSPNQKAILSNLAFHEDSFGSKRCDPSLRTIADETGLKNEGRVSREIRELEAQGYLSVVRARRKIKGKTNSYTLHVEKIDGQGCPSSDQIDGQIDRLNGASSENRRTGVSAYSDENPENRRTNPENRRTPLSDEFLYKSSHYGEQGECRAVSTPNNTFFPQSGDSTLSVRSANETSTNTAKSVDRVIQPPDSNTTLRREHGEPANCDLPKPSPRLAKEIARSNAIKSAREYRDLPGDIQSSVQSFVKNFAGWFEYTATHDQDGELLEDSDRTRSQFPNPSDNWKLKLAQLLADHGESKVFGALKKYANREQGFSGVLNWWALFFSNSELEMNLFLAGKELSSKIAAKKREAQFHKKESAKPPVSPAGQVQMTAGGAA